MNGSSGRVVLQHMVAGISSPLSSTSLSGSEALHQLNLATSSEYRPSTTIDFGIAAFGVHSERAFGVVSKLDRDHYIVWVRSVGDADSGLQLQVTGITDISDTVSSASVVRTGPSWLGCREEAAAPGGTLGMACVVVITFDAAPVALHLASTSLDLESLQVVGSNLIQRVDPNGDGLLIISSSLQVFGSDTAAVRLLGPSTTAVVAVGTEGALDLGATSRGEFLLVQVEIDSDGGIRSSASTSSPLVAPTTTTLYWTGIESGLDTPTSSSSAF